MALVTGILSGGTPLPTTINFRAATSPYTLLYTTTTDASGAYAKVLPSGTYLACAWGYRCTPNVVATAAPKTGMNIRKGTVLEP
jgi:hypothetical protein